MLSEFEMMNKVGEMVLIADMIASGFTDPKGHAARVAAIGRDLLAQAGRPLPAAPPKHALPQGIDARTGRLDAGLQPPAPEEVAALESIHNLPDNPAATAELLKAKGLDPGAATRPTPGPRTGGLDLWA